MLERVRVSLLPRGNVQEYRVIQRHSIELLCVSKFVGYGSGEVV